ncbi:MAG: hypothetical protein DLM52_00385 [Chthoniobacterales bacterium]|nr:MAG: hypothetical protein DLM52_00385 [Chthoniobacterales bacterium]
MSELSLLWRGFDESSRRFPERPAVSVTRDVSYKELAERARRIAATIQLRQSGDAGLTAVFALRSETAYAAVLGALMAGHGYVPLNRTFPVQRTHLMLLRSKCRSVVVDEASTSQLTDVLAGIDDADWPKLQQVVVEVHDEDGRAGALSAQLRARGFDVAGEQEAAMRGTAVRMLYARRR